MTDQAELFGPIRLSDHSFTVYKELRFARIITNLLRMRLQAIHFELKLCTGNSAQMVFPTINCMARASLTVENGFCVVLMDYGVLAISIWRSDS